MHGKPSRSQTRRASRSRLIRKHGPSAVSPERDLTAPGRSGIGAWRSTRIVPLLEVDDLDQASAELACGGAELLGQPESDGTWTWLTFRAPDGNIHSLGARMA